MQTINIPPVVCDGAGAHRRCIRERAFHELAIGGAHALAIPLLPPIHRDPFDRMLVAQARVEGLTLITVDPVVGSYGDSVLLV